jgi:hypothetical protein
MRSGPVAARCKHASADSHPTRGLSDLFLTVLSSALMVLGVVTIYIAEGCGCTIERSAPGFQNQYEGTFKSQTAIEENPTTCCSLDSATQARTCDSGVHSPLLRWQSKEPFLL